MIIICTASADTYITDKIINGNIRVTDANVGHASTLDLFKLYDETKLNGSVSQFEISRALLQFDMQPIVDLTGSILNLNSSKFKAYLQLFDIAGGNSTPSNFNLIVYPLSQSFDEGVGRDTISFNDLDRCNFITASFTSQNNLWFASGANAGGLLGSSDIDFISSGNLGNGVVDLSATQRFLKGTEDLSIDVTKLVSATIAGLIPNDGFRLSFISTEENDQKTRFVKRFASRHVSNPFIRPRILVKFDDTIRDKSGNFTFDLSGSIFLENFDQSSAVNIVSGSALTEITGANCLLLTLNTGSFNFVVTGSQYCAGTNNVPMIGRYFATLAIPSSNSSLVNVSQSLGSFIAASDSVNFNTFWSSLDLTIGYLTGNLTISRSTRSQSNFITRHPSLRVSNTDPYYTTNDTVRFRVFGVDFERQFNQPVKRSRKLSSIIYNKVYYQIFDKMTGNVVIPYDNIDDSTRLSTDSQGMFFDFKMQSLVPGHTYGFQFLIMERGQSYISSEDDTYFDLRS